MAVFIQATASGSTREVSRCPFCFGPLSLGVSPTSQSSSERGTLRSLRCARPSCAWRAELETLRALLTAA